VAKVIARRIVDWRIYSWIYEDSVLDALEHAP